MLDPCSLAFGRRSASGVLRGPPLRPLLFPWMSSVTQVAPLLAHGPLFARPSKLFAAFGVHFWRPRGTYFIVFEVSFTSINFSMHHIQTSNQPASSLVTMKVSHHQSKVSGQYVATNSLLMPREARHLRLVIYIFVLFL